MKLKKMTEEERAYIAGIIDNEGFWYSLADGGWVKPEELIEDQEDIDKVKKAIELLREFEQLMPQL